MPKRNRKRYARGVKRNADLLLSVATVMIGFDGDFVDLAALMGWTSGELWRFNPAIRVAAKRFEARAVSLSR